MLRSFRASVFLFALAGGAAMAADTTTVGMGQALSLPLPRNAARVVLGNPAIADVTLQSPHELVLFGKYPGGTTLLVSDPSGKLILKTSVLVTAAAADGVTIRYGTGKNWVPGGAISAAACGAETCAPPAALTAPAPASSVPGK